MDIRPVIFAIVGLAWAVSGAITGVLLNQVVGVLWLILAELAASNSKKDS